jgi:hypothetical protein
MSRISCGSSSKRSALAALGLVRPLVRLYRCSNRRKTRLTSYFWCKNAQMPEKPARVRLLPASASFIAPKQQSALQVSKFQLSSPSYFLTSCINSICFFSSFILFNLFSNHHLRFNCYRGCVVVSIRLFPSKQTPRSLRSRQCHSLSYRRHHYRHPLVPPSCGCSDTYAKPAIR